MCVDASCAERILRYHGMNDAIDAALKTVYQAVPAVVISTLLYAATASAWWGSP